MRDNEDDPRRSSPESQEPVGRERVSVLRGETPESDWVVVEEPLEIRLGEEPFVVTLRTPGHDLELTAGFLFTEGVIDGPEDLVTLERCRDPLAYDPDNMVTVDLEPRASGRRDRLEKARRDLAAVAACGLCGKARLEDIFQRLPQVRAMERELSFLRTLPPRMRRHQALFRQTGGLHAAALFSAAGELLVVREDVGRHNAVDKVIGERLLARRLPLAEHILVVSARAGFEIVQKAVMAEIPILVTVGAASSLAVKLARDHGLALYSFVGESRGHRHL